MKIVSNFFLNNLLIVTLKEPKIFFIYLLCNIYVKLLGTITTFKIKLLLYCV